jgi:hypothetical protein
MKRTIFTVIISSFFLFGCKKESHETKASDAADRYVGTYAAEVFGGGPGVITITKLGVQIIVFFKEDTQDFDSYDLDFTLTGTYVDEGLDGYFEFDGCTDCLSDLTRYDISGGTIEKEAWSDSKVKFHLEILYPVTTPTGPIFPKTFLIEEI